MGDNALALARRVGELDLGAVTPGDRIYFHVPGVGLLGYAPGWAIPLAGALVLGWAATVALAARRRRLRWWGIPAGLLAAVVALLAAALLPHWVWSTLGTRHPEWGALEGRAIHREWPYALAAIAISVAVVSGLYGLLRRWVGLEGLALGALLVPLAGAGALAVLLPAGSYLLLWPAALSTGMVAIGAGARGTTPRGWPRARLAAAAGGVLVLMVPVLYMVQVLLGIPVAALLGLVAALLALLLLPILDLAAPPHRAWLPAAAVAAAGVLVGVGVAGATPTPDRPAPSNVLHVQDAETGEARWAAPASQVDAYTTRFVPADAPTAPLGDVARVLGYRTYRVAPAPAWTASPALVTVLEDREHDGLRRVRLRLEWAEPPMRVEVRPDGDDSRLLEPTGRPGGRAGAGAADDDAPGPGRWHLERSGLQWPLELVVEAPAGAAIRLLVSARYPGLPDVDTAREPRPPGLMATPAYVWLPTLTDVRLLHQRLEL
jgi:hypothetical protein